MASQLPDFTVISNAFTEISRGFEIIAHHALAAGQDVFNQLNMLRRDIAQYQTRLDEHIEASEKRVDQRPQALEGRIGTLEQRVQDLEGLIHALEGQVQSLGGRLQPIENFVEQAPMRTRNVAYSDLIGPDGPIPANLPNTRGKISAANHIELNQLHAHLGGNFDGYDFNLRLEDKRGIICDFLGIPRLE
ncbi:hypothetical protein C8Q75DRAFT_811354 [Abortiporus biennis]|nr:hypothetical protein C8Q75DRAFT_811354 [Abortiporus biennis]